MSAEALPSGSSLGRVRRGNVHVIRRGLYFPAKKLGSHEFAPQNGCRLVRMSLHREKARQRQYAGSLRRWQHRNRRALRNPVQLCERARRKPEGGGEEAFERGVLLEQDLLDHRLALRLHSAAHRLAPQREGIDVFRDHFEASQLEPLSIKLRHRTTRLRILQHSARLVRNLLRRLELAGLGGVEQGLVGSRRPDQVRKARGGFVAIQAHHPGAGRLSPGKLHSKQEVGRLESRPDHDFDPLLEAVTESVGLHQRSDILRLEGASVRPSAKRLRELASTRLFVEGCGIALHEGVELGDNFLGQRFSSKGVFFRVKGRNSQDQCVVAESFGHLIGRKVGRRCQRRPEQVPHGVVVLEASEAPQGRRRSLERRAIDQRPVVRKDLVRRDVRTSGDPLASTWIGGFARRQKETRGDDPGEECTPPRRKPTALARTEGDALNGPGGWADLLHRGGGVTTPFRRFKK